MNDIPIPDLPLPSPWDTGASDAVRAAAHYHRSKEHMKPTTEAPFPIIPRDLCQLVMAGARACAASMHTVAMAKPGSVEATLAIAVLGDWGIAFKEEPAAPESAPAQEEDLPWPPPAPALPVGYKETAYVLLRDTMAYAAHDGPGALPLVPLKRHTLRFLGQAEWLRGTGSWLLRMEALDETLTTPLQVWVSSRDIKPQ